MKVVNFLLLISSFNVFVSKQYFCFSSSDIFIKNWSNILSIHCGATSPNTFLVSVSPFSISKVCVSSCTKLYKSLKSPLIGANTLIGLLSEFPVFASPVPSYLLTSRYTSLLLFSSISLILIDISLSILSKKLFTISSVSCSEILVFNW